MAERKIDPSILIVDDDRSTIEMLSMLLKKNGYEVGTAYNGREAVDFLKKRSYDIIITDLKMPDIDGYQLLDIVKTSYRDHKVMVMTADILKKEKLLRKGAIEAFSKPFNLKTFVEELKILLQERRKTKRFLSKEKIQCTVKNPNNSKKWNGNIGDISIDGALVEIENKETKDLKNVELDFFSYDNSRVIGTVTGKVVRIIKSENPKIIFLGIYFDDNRDLTLLDKLGNTIRLKSSAATAAS